MDTIAMDTYDFIAAGAVAVVDVVQLQMDWTPGGPAGEQPASGGRFSARRRQANDGRKARLRTVVRCVIIAGAGHKMRHDLLPPPSGTDRATPWGAESAQTRDASPLAS